MKYNLFSSQQIINYRTMWILTILLLKVVTSSTFIIGDQCTDICKNAQLPALELDHYEQVVCQRGCRFFNIIKFNTKDDQNTRKKECFSTCDESYIEQKENEICQMGCDLMSQEYGAELSGIIIEESSIVLASPDQDVDLDLLSDPSIKNQLEIGFNIDYKIPETHIRTMPIEVKEITKDSSGDWLECASRNSGIPRWILLASISLAVLVALWLSLASDKKSSQDDNNVDIDIPDDRLILENDDLVMEKDPCMLETPPLYYGMKDNEDFEVSPPPYEDTLVSVSEKV